MALGSWFKSWQRPFCVGFACSPCVWLFVLFVFMWLCDGLVTCPGCTLPSDSWNRLQSPHVECNKGDHQVGPIHYTPENTHAPQNPACECVLCAGARGERVMGPMEQCVSVCKDYKQTHTQKYFMKLLFAHDTIVFAQ